MIFYILFAVFTSLFINGYYFNYIDSNVYLAYLNKIEDPSLYVGDYLFNQGQSNYSLFNLLLVIIKKNFGLNYQWLFFLLFLLTSFLLYFSIYKLTYKISRSQPASILAVAFFLLPKWVASVGNFTHARFFAYRDLGFALAIFSLIFILEKKMILSFFLFICIMLVNPTVTPPLLIFWFFMQTKKIKKILLLLVLFTLVPALIIYLVKTGNQITDTKWFEIMQERAKYSFPLLWKYSGWLNLSFYLFLLLISLFMTEKKVFGKYRYKIIFFIYLCLLIFSFHLVISSFIPIAYLIQFQLLRSIGFVCLLSLISFAIFCSVKIIKYPIITTIIIFFVYFWGDHLTFWHFLASFIFFIVIFFNLKFKDFRLTISSPLIYLMVSLIIFFHFLYTLFVKKPQIFLPYYLATPTFYEHFDTKDYWQWMDVQLWTAFNTPKESIFFTPPNREGFRVMSKRQILGESKDGSVIFYSPEYARDWRNRNELLYRYYFKDYEKLSDLKKILPYDYLVTEKNKGCGEAKKVFENDYFLVCKPK
jgi:hypothetical protein